MGPASNSVNNSTLPITPELDLSAFSNAPVAILALFIQHLSLADVGRNARASRKFNVAANDALVWNRKAIEYDMPETFGDRQQHIKIRLRDFLVGMKQISQIYPEKVLNAFGGAKNVVLFPRLDLGTRRGDSNWIDFISPDMMKGHKIMRGVDCVNRSFISICAMVTNSQRQWKNGLEVQTFFRRYTEEDSSWMCAGEQLVAMRGGVSDEVYARIAQLVQSNSCQLIDEEAGLVTLTDQATAPQPAVGETVGHRDHD